MIRSFNGRTLIIAESAFISEAAYVIGDVRIGNDVLIGINATLLHDVVIENYCIIAAAALVKQGMQVPDKSFVVGVPAQIKREATPEQLWWVGAGTQGISQFDEDLQKGVRWRC